MYCTSLLRILKIPGLTAPLGVLLFWLFSVILASWNSVLKQVPMPS
jgi:hypothetical protein